MKIFKLFFVIIISNSLTNISKGQQTHNPGGVKSPAYWFVAEQTTGTTGFRNKVKGDSVLIPYSDLTRLNFNPSLMFNGNSSLSITLDKKNLDIATYFTVYKTSDTSHEKVIWHTVKDNKTNLVLTTNRIADLTSVQYMNYTDVIKENPKINIYLQQSGKLNYTPLKHTILLGAKLLSLSPSVSSFKGNIPEIIIYNRILSGQQRLRVSSYLALKYGITLTDPEAIYLNSTGKKIWDGAKYSSFHHNVAGICRDDSSGLMQPVSESSNTPGLLTVFALNKLTDKNYLVWGDNGMSLQEDDRIAGLPMLLHKKWLFVPNLNMTLLNADVVIDTKQLDVPLPPKPVYWLAIDSSGTGNFPAGNTAFIKMSQLDQQGKAHFKGLKWYAEKPLKNVLGIVVAQDLLLFSEVKGPACNANNTGSISIKILGGSAPYQLSVTGNAQGLYNNSVSGGQTPVLISNLKTGNYILRVTDAAKQVYTDSFYINYADAPKPSLVKSNYDLYPHVKLDLNAADRMPAGISYEWTGPDNFLSLNPIVSITKPGIYTLKSSKGGCFYQQEVKVNGIPNDVFKRVTVYPNPSAGIFNIQINLNWVTAVNMNIYTSDGRLIRSRNINGKANYFFSEELPVNGAYELVFTSGEAKVTRRIIINK